MLSKLQLLEAIVVQEGPIVISELRLSYYSGPKQFEVRGLAQKGLVRFDDHPDDLYEFIQTYSGAFPHAGDGVLILVHLCLSSGCTLIIEEDQEMVVDMASFFNVPIMAVKDFYKQKIKNQQYHQFLIEHFNG
ncbi:hypothetical protein [Pedobacter sp.]